MDARPQVRPTTAVMTALPVIFKTSPPRSTRSLSVAKTITYVLHSGSLWGLSTQCTGQSLLSSACFLVLPVGQGSFNFYRDLSHGYKCTCLIRHTSIIVSKRQSTDFTDRSCTGEGRPHESWRRRKYCSGDADSGLHPPRLYYLQ